MGFYFLSRQVSILQETYNGSSISALESSQCWRKVSCDNASTCKVYAFLGVTVERSYMLKLLIKSISCDQVFVNRSDESYESPLDQWHNAMVGMFGADNLVYHSPL